MHRGCKKLREDRELLRKVMILIYHWGFYLSNTHTHTLAHSNFVKWTTASLPFLWRADTMTHQDGNIFPFSSWVLHANNSIQKYLWENKTAVPFKLEWDKTLVLVDPYLTKMSVRFILYCGAFPAFKFL